MKRIGRMFVLAMVMAGLLMPGFGGTTAAQDASLCDDALAVWQDSGTSLGKYAIVEFIGGAGSQIVLGYGDATLSGGSGNDVLCAWGSGNILDGGSGNDLLVALEGPVNTFRGGSGNDTMIGVEGDVFDGGSGRDVIDAQAPLPEMTLSVVWTLYQSGIGFTGELTGSGLRPGADVVATYTYIPGLGFDTSRTLAVVDDDGNTYYSFGGTTCNYHASIAFSTLDRNGDPIVVDEPVPC